MIDSNKLRKRYHAKSHLGNFTKTFYPISRQKQEEYRKIEKAFDKFFDEMDSWKIKTEFFRSLYFEFEVYSSNPGKPWLGFSHKDPGLSPVYIISLNNFAENKLLHNDYFELNGRFLNETSVSLIDILVSIMLDTIQCYPSKIEKELMNTKGSPFTFEKLKHFIVRWIKTKAEVKKFGGNDKLEKMAYYEGGLGYYGLDCENCLNKYLGMSSGAAIVFYHTYEIDPNRKFPSNRNK